MKKYYLRTFGCQMNENDSEKMESYLQSEGYQKTTSLKEAQVVVFNTCSIREHAYQKAVSEIGRSGKNAARKAEKPIIAVTGCVASHDGKKILKKFPFVDFALSPDHISALPRLIRERKNNSVQPQVALTDFQDISDYEFPKPMAWEKSDHKKVKAYVTIMKGCDNTCSFCIVPFTRGQEVSREMNEVVHEIRDLAAQGVREVMLLGQNVNSYGKNLRGTSFAKLLALIDEQTKIDRIRFTSPHPKDLSRELVEEYQTNSKLCPHIHLPVQSGSSSLLKQMRRAYTRDVYLRKIKEVRQVRPDIAITTDIIVGFPGETEKDFQATLDLVEEVRFDSSYSFVFSPRPNTEAAKFVDDVPLAVKKERLTRLQELQEKVSQEKNDQLIGKIESVLVEGPSFGKKGQLTGRSPHGRIVNFDGDESLIGAILDVEVTEASPYSLKGKWLSQ